MKARGYDDRGLFYFIRCPDVPFGVYSLIKPAKYRLSYFSWLAVA
jgi:hypothetical protein